MMETFKLNGLCDPVFLHPHVCGTRGCLLLFAASPMENQRLTTDHRSGIIPRLPQTKESQTSLDCFRFLNLCLASVHSAEMYLVFIFKRDRSAKFTLV